MDKKFSWGFLGFLVALLFGGITVYQTFIEDKHPRLEYEVLTSTSVFDLREDVSNLSVLVDGSDIRKQQQALRVITVRVHNPSSKDVLKIHYDERAPLGLFLSIGQIIRVELVNASSDYLRENAAPSKQDEQTVMFPPVIIEAGESFTFKILLLHPEAEAPVLFQKGKIAGIESIPIRELFRETAEEPLLSEAFQGSLYAQLLRLIVYCLVGIILLVVSIIIFASVDSYNTKRRRERDVKEYKKLERVKMTELDDYIFEQYVSHGGIWLQAAHSVITNPNRLARLCKSRKAALDSEHIETLMSKRLLRGHEWYFLRSLPSLELRSMIQQKDDLYVVNDHFSVLIKDFMEFLKVEGKGNAPVADVALTCG